MGLCRYTEDSYYSGNYNSEIEDLRAVVQYFSALNRPVAAVLGHSKGIIQCIFMHIQENIQQVYTNMKT